MDGILRCSRYAFGPNRLHYCGPDANRELLAYIQEEVADPGLQKILRGFRTMYPYLRHIAEANGIRDPFDERVVEAYWIGNDLLETIAKKKFYQHLLEGLELKRYLGGKSFERIVDKIDQGAVPHHSFHVLDIWKRTGHVEREQTLESMDSCRISWGKVKALDGPKIIVDTEPLMYSNKKLYLGPPVQKELYRRLESEPDIEQLQVGQIVSIHWGVPCEVISSQQARILRRYTLRHIALANLTL